MDVYDLIIIGSGPAGLTAALYAARAGLKTVIFEEGTLGGAIVNSPLVENFPSYPNGISGADLSSNLVSQVMQYEVEFKLSSVTGIHLLKDDLKEVLTPGENYLAKVVIIAGGAKPKKLEVPGVEKYEDLLSYCAYCDGNRFENNAVAVIGGGDTGITEALYLTRMAPKVTVIELLPRLNACRVLQQRVAENSKIEIVCSSAVEEITGEGDIVNLRCKDVETGKIRNVEVSGVFVHMGLVPETGFVKELVTLDDSGFILVNAHMATNIPGIFAAGDIRSGSARQWVVAAGDGATAAIAAEKYITSEFEKRK